VSASASVPTRHRKSQTQTHVQPEHDLGRNEQSGAARASATSSKWWDGDKSEGIAVYNAAPEVRAHRGAVSGLCASRRGGEHALSVSIDGSLSQLTLSDDTCALTRRMTVGKLPLGCCVEVRDGLALCGSWDNSLYLCAVEQGRVVQRIQGHEDAVGCVGASSSGRVLVSGSWDSSLRAWGYSPSPPSFASSGGSQQLARPTFGALSAVAATFDHHTAVTCLDVDSAGHLCVSAGADGQVLVHDLRLGGAEAPVAVLRSGLEQRGARPVSVHWVRGESTVLCVGSDGVLDALELAGGRGSTAAPVVDALLAPGTRVTCAAVTPDRLNAVIGTSCGRLMLCNVDVLRGLSTRSASRTLFKPPPQGQAPAAPVAPQAHALASRWDGAAHLDGLPDHAVSSVACALGPNGPAVIAGTCGGTVRVLSRAK
jgi:WD40 repeat protein